jgi:general stress protein YciG
MQPNTTRSDRRSEQIETFPAEEAKTEGQLLLPDPPPHGCAVDLLRKPLRGFAAMDRGLQREIAMKGARPSMPVGPRTFTSEEAREAGRKGGRATHAKRRRVPEKP